MPGRHSRRHPTAPLATLCLLLGGCAGLRIHDEGRSALATQARTGYEAVKVDEVTATENRNLVFLLGEEIKALRSNTQLQADLTMLSMAASDSPLAIDLREAGGRLKQLGVSGANLATMRGAQPQIDAAARQLATRAKVYRSFGAAPPDCRNLPATPVLPDGLSDANRKLLIDNDTAYRAACRGVDPRTYFGDGEIGSAYVAWNDARLVLDARRAESADAARELAAASADYQTQADVLAAQKLSGEALRTKLQEQAARLANALTKARALDVGAETDEVLGSLAELLTAAAGGSADNASPSLEKALIVAKQLPALAGDIAQFEADRHLPPVSGLLLAMRHQALLASAAQQRAALAQERVDVLKARADGLVAEADAWVGFSDALCSHAVLLSGGRHPGVACKDFVVQQAADKTWSCALAGKSIPNCVLAQSWKARLRGTSAGEARRELAKAEMRYLQAQAAAAVPTEQRFREIDVRHRESLLAKQTALKAWDNLISTPLVQLDGFHQTGLKPQELADLIVKALGFTAIAIGVAK